MFTKTSPSKMILMEKFLKISKRETGEKANQTINLLPGFLGSKGYRWDIEWLIRHIAKKL